MHQAVRCTTIFRFGPFEFDPDAGELRKHGLKLHVVGQPLEILALLLELPGKVVHREELQKRLWAADTFVEFEHGVNAAVKRLREALGDSADQPRYVETIPRRGYRFIAPVTRVTKDGAGVSTGPELDHAATIQRDVPTTRPRFSRKRIFRSLAPLVLVVVTAIFLHWILGKGSRATWAHFPYSASPRIASIAVLPLTNLSGDSEQEYFADGVTDELITQLVTISALKVTSRTSVMRYKGTKKSLPEIAHELGVDAIVEGTVVRSGNHVRISAQLIDALSDTHLWSQAYERDLEDILALQAEVALAIAKRVSVTVTSEQKKQLESAPSVNPKAYEFYLKGQHQFWRRDAKKAVENLTRAVELDPNYGKAYAGLALSYVLLEGSLTPREAIAKARAAATRALQIDSTLAEPHAALGWAKLGYDRDWAGAEQEFKLAKELNPNYETAPFWYGCELIWEGQFERGFSEMRRAKQLAPTSTIINVFFGMAFYQARQNQEAIQQLQEAIQLDPAAPESHNWLGLTYLQMGMKEQAIAELEKATELARTQQVRVGAAVSRLGFAYGIAGRRKQAEEALDELAQMAETRYVSEVNFANVYIGLGDKDQALQWLEKGYRNRPYEMMVLKVDPRFDSLRSDPRFQDLLQRMHFPE